MLVSAVEALSAAMEDLKRKIRTHPDYQCTIHPPSFALSNCFASLIAQPLLLLAPLDLQSSHFLLLTRIIRDTELIEWIVGMLLDLLVEQIMILLQPQSLMFLLDLGAAQLAFCGHKDG